MTCHSTARDAAVQRIGSADSPDWLLDDQGHSLQQGVSTSSVLRRLCRAPRVWTGIRSCLIIYGKRGNGLVRLGEPLPPVLAKGLY